MILYGASGHAKVIIDILKQNKIPVNAIYDDAAPFELLGYKVNKPEINCPNDEALIISIGRNSTRQKLSQKLHQCNFGIAIHPSAIIDPTAKINEGTVIMAGTIINSSVKIGKHCIINTAASIDHDCVIDDFAHISPNATLCGNVTIGEGTHVGAGAVIIPGIKIGKWVTIGAGAVIIKDIPDYATVVGNPGKIIKTKNI
jgi:sugar O-acyltransferase (sialic acid O-acetyltransferase NeuD family)